MLTEGLDEAVSDLYPVEFSLPNDDKICLQITSASIGVPLVPAGTIGVKNQRVYPAECRQRAYTYKAKMILNISWSINGRQQPTFEKEVGEVPIMLKVSHKILTRQPFYNASQF